MPNTQATNIPAQDFIDSIRSADEGVSGPAVESAFIQGSAAVRPLAQLLAADDFELARRARRALYVIVRNATRPGTGRAATAVEMELGAALQDCTATSTRRQLLWMLSEIGHDRSIPIVAHFLTDTELREDARCVLIRIPGKRAVAALRAALPNATEGFKPALIDALRKRSAEATGVGPAHAVETR